MKNLKKSLSKCIQLLIIWLQQLQHDLQEALHNDIFLHNKLVINCQEISACRYAVIDSFSEIKSLINKLQFFIMIFEKENLILTQVYYTNHCYYREKKQYLKQDSTWIFNHCFVCNKKNCWSWKYTDKEWDEAKSKFKIKFFL